MVFPICVSSKIQILETENLRVLLGESSNYLGLILLHKNNFSPLCIFIGLGAWREGGRLTAVRVNLASDPVCSADLTHAKTNRLALDTCFDLAYFTPAPT